MTNPYNTAVITYDLDRMDDPIEGFFRRPITIQGFPNIRVFGVYEQEVTQEGAPNEPRERIAGYEVAGYVQNVANVAANMGCASERGLIEQVRTIPPEERPGLTEVIHKAMNTTLPVKFYEKS